MVPDTLLPCAGEGQGAWSRRPVAGPDVVAADARPDVRRRPGAAAAIAGGS